MAVHTLDQSERHLELQVTRIAHVIQSYRLTLSDELCLHDEIEDIFIKADMDFDREYILAKESIVDFMMDQSIALEVKLRGHSKQQIYRQLKRYAQYDEVKALMLVTNVSMGLPPIINDKPLYYISLSLRWL